MIYKNVLFIFAKSVKFKYWITRTCADGISIKMGKLENMTDLITYTWSKSDWSQKNIFKSMFKTAHKIETTQYGRILYIFWNFIAQWF